MFPAISLKQLADGNFERVGQFNQGCQPQVLLSALNCPCKRPSQATFVGKVLLRPFLLLAESSDALAQLLPDVDGVVHSPTFEASPSIRPRSQIGRSIVGILWFNA